MLVYRLMIALVAATVVVADEEPTTIEIPANEQVLVSYQRQEALWRRQIYRETSMRAKERHDNYQRDLKGAKADKARFVKELAEIEAADPVDIVELERVLNGVKAADRAIDICVEALLVVNTAQRQFAKHRELINKSRARLRQALGAEPDTCGLHKVAIDHVRVPVVKPGDKPDADDLTMRIRTFPLAAEPFETPDAGTPNSPETIVVPVCPKCTAARQLWLQLKKNESRQ